MIVKRSASGFGATANSLLAAIERRGLTAAVLGAFPRGVALSLHAAFQADERHHRNELAV